MVELWRWLNLMLSQTGDRYVFGAQASLSDSDPDAFDCSELIRWASGRLGVRPTVPDGSWYQARHVRDRGQLLSIREAVETPGALLFRFSSSPYVGGRPSFAHVAVSLGNGSTIEARSSSHGVGQFSAHGRGWTHAGLIPGIDYTKEAPPVALQEYEKEAIARLEAEGIFTSFTTDEPGEVDQPVTVRKFAVFVDRLLDGIPKATGTTSRQAIVAAIVDELTN